MRPTIFLSLALLLSLPSCGPINWPAVVSCGIEPAQPLVTDAIQILQQGGDTKKRMEALALNYGAEAVICVVRSLVMQSEGFAGASQPLGPEAVERARAFLHEVGH